MQATDVSARTRSRQRQMAAVILPYVAGLLVTAALVFFCYDHVDRPVARAMHAWSSAGGVGASLGAPFGLRLLARLPELFALLAAPVLVAVIALRLSRGHWGTASRLLLLCAISFSVGETIKGYLKGVFGRPWPESWLGWNPSFIENGWYGFHPFHGGGAYASFPSGHMTAVCSVIGVLHRAWPPHWPRWPRSALLAAPALTAIGLIGLDYHFVSDVIAGAYLGTAVARATAQIGAVAVSPARR